MDIESLRTLLAFVETGSFTRASIQTYRSQGAVSMQMKKLESELDQKLFEKRGRSVGLTREGKQLISYARQIVHLHDEAISQFQSKVDIIKVGCPDDFADNILVGLIKFIRYHYPQTQIQIETCNTTKLRQSFDRGQLDLVVITRHSGSDEGYFLAVSPGVWVGDIKLLDSDVLPLVLYEADCRIRSAAIDGLEKAHMNYQIISESESATSILAQVDAGIGISPMVLPSIGNRDILHCLPNLPLEEIVLLIKPNSGIDMSIVDFLKDEIISCLRYSAIDTTCK